MTGVRFLAAALWVPLATAGRVAFSFLVNNFEGPGAPVTAIMDQLALALLQEFQ